MTSVLDSFWWPRQLRAAIWVIRTIGDGRVPSQAVEASFTKLPLGGVIGLGELQSALEALIRDGIVAREGETLWVDSEILPDQLVENGSEVELLALILERTSPVWLRLASSDGLEFRPEYLPAEMEQSLNALIRDAGQREEFLLKRGKTFSNEETKRIGEAGEQLVLEALREELIELDQPSLAVQVVKVSEISDELGYDITAPRLDGSTRRLEVKSSMSPSKSFVFYLSRNEFEVGLQDSDWYLVAVRFSENGGRILGWIDGSALEELVPIDRSEGGVWVSTRVDIGQQFFTPGIPEAKTKGV